MPKAGYTSYSDEKYHSAFATILREELIPTPEKARELANYLGVSIQAVNQYKQGQGFPKTENLVKIAQYFNRSLDNLIGLSDVSTPEANIQAIAEYTGLSESAVEHLHTCVEQLNPENTYFNIVSDLLSGDDFYNAIAYLKQAKQIEEKASERRKSDPDSFDKVQAFHESLADMAVMRNKSGQGVYLSLRQSVDFYLQCAVDCYKRLCDSMLKGVDK